MAWLSQYVQQDIFSCPKKQKKQMIKNSVSRLTPLLSSKKKNTGLACFPLAGINSATGIAAAGCCRFPEKVVAAALAPQGLPLPHPPVFSWQWLKGQTEILCSGSGHQRSGFAPASCNAHDLEFAAGSHVSA